MSLNKSENQEAFTWYFTLTILALILFLIQTKSTQPSNEPENKDYQDSNKDQTRLIYP